MTISSAYTPTIYTGNGVTTAFATGFPFGSNEHLVVSLIRLSDSAESLLIYGVNYTVSGAGSPSGGTVTTTSLVGAFGPSYPTHPLTSSYQIKIKRRTPQVQTLDLVANDGAPAESQERAYDLLTMMVQELGQTITDLVTAPGGVLITNGSAPALPYPYTYFPWYSGIFGGYYKFRQLVTGTPFFSQYSIDDNLTIMRETGLHDAAYMAGGGDAVTGRGDSVIQLKTVSWDDKAIAIWQGDAAANAGKWGIGPTLDGVLSIGTLSDDHATWNDHVRFLRSGVTPTSVQQQVTFDMNAKRLGNVGAFDFDESAKGTTSGSITFDFSTFSCYSITLNGAVTATFTAPNGPTTTYIECTQDGTGSRVLTFPAAVKWTAATVAGDKLLSTGANKRDLVVLKWNAAGTACLAQIFKDW